MDPHLFHSELVRGQPWFNRARKDNPPWGKAKAPYYRFLRTAGKRGQCADGLSGEARWNATASREDVCLTCGAVLGWERSGQIREINRDINSYCILSSFKCQVL